MTYQWYDMIRHYIIGLWRYKLKKKLQIYSFIPKTLIETTPFKMAFIQHSSLIIQI